MKNVTTSLFNRSGKNLLLPTSHKKNLQEQISKLWLLMKCLYFIKLFWTRIGKSTYDTMLNGTGRILDWWSLPCKLSYLKSSSGSCHIYNNYRSNHLETSLEECITYWCILKCLQQNMNPKYVILSTNSWQFDVNIYLTNHERTVIWDFRQSNSDKFTSKVHYMWLTKDVAKSGLLLLSVCPTISSSTKAIDILPLLQWPMGMIVMQNK